MNKTIVAIVAIVALATIAAVYIWSSHNRYYLVTRSPGGTYGTQRAADVFDVDKRTGQTWYVSGGSKRLIADSQLEHPLQDIPASDIASLTGRGGYSYEDRFRCHIYNATDWEIREIRIGLYSVAPGQAEWRRVFAETVSIHAFSSGEFSFDTIDGHTAGATNWSIVAARGFRK